MEALIIRQSLKNGTVKSAKLRLDKKLQTFGSSRLADVIALSPDCQGIQGVFEYRNGNWWYIDLNFKGSSTRSTSPETVIDQHRTIDVGDCTLEFLPLKNQDEIFDKIENSHYNSALGRNFQIFIVRQNKKVVETKVLPLNKIFHANSLERKVKPVIGETWYSENFGEFEIRQKTISLEDAKKWAQLTPDQIIDEDSKKGLYVIFGSALLILTLAIFSPKSQTLQTIAAPPKVTQKILVKSEIKQKRKVLRQEVVTAPPVIESRPVAESQNPAETTSAASPEAPKANQSGKGKVSQLMKSISAGKVSQLLGKVSASSAKSENLIISNGKKAGSGESGRALANLGSIEKSGRNWGSESGGSKVVISTVGRGGGKSTGKLGGLTAGTTGNAGVGLIEDEGEITGGLDREIIAQYIKSKLGQILYCYERQLSANPDLFGKVAVKFTIGATGAVEQQMINDTTLKNANVEGCILSKISNWKFPTPEGGTKVVVTYPFLFKSTN